MANNYHLTEIDLKELIERGYSQEEIGNAEMHLFTLERWLNTEESMSPFNASGWGIEAYNFDENNKAVAKGEGALALYILPEEEAGKIEQRKNEIVEGFVGAYRTSLINWFESQFKKSLEKKIFTEKELAKVEILLFGKDLDFRYHSYDEGLWLTFYNYPQKGAGAMRDWYERICTDGEAPGRFVSREHAHMTAQELNKNHPDSLHYVVAALALHLFKEFLKNKLDEGEELELTVEDWLNQSEKWKDVDKYPDKSPIQRPFKRHMAKGLDGEYNFYSLSDQELQKIKAYQNDIFESKVALFLKGQIEDFEIRFANSFEKKLLVETELKSAEVWLTDINLSGGYVFPNPDGGTFVLGDLGLSERKDGEGINHLPYWYDKVIINGEIASSYIQPEHSKSLGMMYPVAVHVIHRYKKFLQTHSIEEFVPALENQEIIKRKDEAFEELKILKGLNVHGEKIMSDTDFERLRGYVDRMIEANGLPDNLEPISQIIFPNGHVSYLFYLIHKRLYSTKKIRKYFIEFLHIVFVQFKGDKETTKKRFSIKPESWDMDFKEINK